MTAVLVVCCDRCGAYAPGELLDLVLRTPAGREVAAHLCGGCAAALTA